MLVTVIIPTYNSAKYISSSIKSVQEQTYKNWELIIVDDGSKDNTKEVVASFDDERIKYIYQDNAGVAIARNNGIKHSKGEFIAFLDADDIWKPNKLEIQVKKMKSDNEICMVYSGFVMFYEGSDLEQTFRYSIENRKEKNFISKLLVDPFKTIPYPSTVMLRKSYLDKTEYFDSSYPTGEDWNLWLKLAAMGKCSYVDYLLIRKRTHIESITNSISLEETGKHHFRLLDNFFENNPKYKPLRKKSHSVIYYDLACRAFARKDYEVSKEFYGNLFKSAATYPGLYFSKEKIQFLFKVAGKSWEKLHSVRRN